MFSPLVSVVVLNYNGRSILKECLDSILSQNYPNFEVLLVDNGSKDNSLEFVRESYQDTRLKIIENGANLGVSEGHNAGIRKAKGIYILFLDNDTWIEEKCIENLVTTLESDQTIGAAQAKLVIASEPNTFDCTGGFMDYHGITCERGHLKKDKGQYESIDEIFYCKLSAMIVRADVLNAVGELDSKYFMHFDETDLCWRIWLNGHRLVYIPKVKVHHRANYTITGIGANQMYFLTRNCILSIIKNYEFHNVVRNLSALLSMEITRALNYLLTRKIDKGKTLIRSITWNLINLKSTLKKRSLIQYKIRQISDRTLMQRILIKPNPLPLRLIHRKYRITKCQV